MDIKIKHKGLPAHFICGSRCIYHRHTLLTSEANHHIIVSTVGRMMDIHTPGWPNKISYDTLGSDNRMYETMVFCGTPCPDCKPPCGLICIDTNRTLSLPLPWQINYIDYIDNTTDAAADNMHDAAVDYVHQNFYSLYIHE